MLFDEPTSALDVELVREVLDVMEGLARDGMTMVVVSHELRFAHHVASSILMMDEGQVIEEAPPDRFFSVAGARADAAVPGARRVADCHDVDVRTVATVNDCGAVWPYRRRQ